MKLTINILVILVLLLSSGWLGIYGWNAVCLTAKNSAMAGAEHIKAELACQAPPHRLMTNRVIGAPNPVYKDYFSPNEEVWAAVDPKTGGCDHSYESARIYIVNHKPKEQWFDNTPLEDVSADGYNSITIQPGSANGNYTQIWSNLAVREEGYDVVVDFAPFGCYNKGRDILDGLEGKGFYVPEVWVCLESISFNYDPHSCTSDAMNTRKNWIEDGHVPEWRLGKKSYPAAYIKNANITIKAVFSSSTNAQTAMISADTSLGSLGDLKPVTASFKNGRDNCECKSRISYPVSFQVSIPTPGEIKLFYQEWRWYFEGVNGESTPKVHIGNSMNKIYIVLCEPQCPWTVYGKTQPWTDVLDLVCLWAEGETTPGGAAAKITQHLYNGLGGIYTQGSSFYTYSSQTQDFFLTDFLENIPRIKNVNCFDMGKALVTFSNAVGCDSRYMLSDPFGELKCVKPIGRYFGYCKEFKDHAFASLGGKIFDACIKVKPGTGTDCPPSGDGEWLTGISWSDYQKKVLKNGNPGEPKPYPFCIDGESKK